MSSSVDHDSPEVEPWHVYDIHFTNGQLTRKTQVGKLQCFIEYVMKGGEGATSFPCSIEGHLLYKSLKGR